MMTLIKRLSFATALGIVSISSYAASSSTGPTLPKESVTPPATQGIEPNINQDSKIHNDADTPTHPSVDPRIQGNDAGRQGGMNTDGNGPIGDGGRSVQPRSSLPGAVKP